MVAEAVVKRLDGVPHRGRVEEVDEKPFGRHDGHGCGNSADVADSSFNARAYGNRTCVPLYCCRACGFATTASWRNAVTAHEVGAPHCEGELEMRASFAPQPPAFPRRIAPAGGVRQGAELGHPSTDSARDPA